MIVTAAGTLLLIVSGCGGHAFNSLLSTPAAAVLTSDSPTESPYIIKTPLQTQSTSNTAASGTGYFGLVSPPRPGQPPDQIWVDAYQCTPNVLTIKAGTTITWVDFDVHDYTIISDDPGLFSGEIVPSEFGFGFPGPQTFSYRFTTTGSYGWSAPPDYFVTMGLVIVVP